MHTWQLQEAKNKLSQVVDNAVNEGPQVITRHGAEVAVVVSVAEYRKLVSSQKKLSDFLRESPLAGVDLDLTRDRSLLRSALDL